MDFKHRAANDCKSYTTLCLCAQMVAVEQDVITNTESLAISRTEIKDLRSTLQRLEIELQSHLSMVGPVWLG